MISDIFIQPFRLCNKKLRKQKKIGTRNVLSGRKINSITRISKLDEDLSTAICKFHFVCNIKTGARFFSPCIKGIRAMPAQVNHKFSFSGKEKTPRSLTNDHNFLCEIRQEPPTFKQDQNAFVDFLGDSCAVTDLAFFIICELRIHVRILFIGILNTLRNRKTVKCKQLYIINKKLMIYECI